MRTVARNTLKNSIAVKYKKVVSIIVLFFISLKNITLDLLKKIYIKKELINVY